MARKRDGLNDKDVVEFIGAQKEEARDQRRDTLESYWKEVENLYLNKMDFSKKKGWQAKMFYSLTSPTINRAARTIKQMLMKSEDYFVMDYIGTEDIPLARAMQNAVKFYLNNAQFPERFSEGCASGFLYSIGIISMNCKVVKQTVLLNGRERTRDVTKLNIKTVNPWDFYWPKDWSFCIEDVWTTIPELLQDANAKDYDMTKVREAIGKDYAVEVPGGESADNEKARLARIGVGGSSNKFRKPALLSTYWGPLINKKGEVVEDNQRVILLNEKYIIKGPERNPFAHQKWPYIFITPIKMLFRHFGDGLTWGVTPVQKELTNVLNLMSDSLKFKMVGVVEVNEELLTERERMRPLELYPGKAVRKRGDSRGKALEHHELGADPEWASGFIYLLRTIYQNHTGITDWIMGAPTLKGSPTATEVATKTAAGQSDFESIAEDVDRQGIVGAAEMCKDLLLQYYTDISSYPNVQRIFSDPKTGEFLMDLTSVQKEELLLGDWDIQARGLSNWFERKEQINKLRAHNDFLKAIPPEIALTKVDWKSIGEAWSEALWGDKDKFWLETPAEQPPMQLQGPEMQQGELPVQNIQGLLGEGEEQPGMPMLPPDMGGLA